MIGRERGKELQNIIELKGWIGIISIILAIVVICYTLQDDLIFGGILILAITLFWILLEMWEMQMLLITLFTEDKKK